jgi:hypothetical protein
MTFFSALYRHRKLAPRTRHSALRPYLYRSYPAARAEPRVGSFAFSDRRLMSRLDAEETSTPGSGETLRFLVSGCSVAIAIVWVEERYAFVEVKRVLGQLMGGVCKRVNSDMYPSGRDPRRYQAETWMPTPASVRALVRATPTIVRLRDRAFINVSGSQAAEFLNGLLSTTVTTQRHASAYSSFLHAQVSSVGWFRLQSLDFTADLGACHIRCLRSCQT